MSRPRASLLFFCYPVLLCVACGGSSAPGPSSCAGMGVSPATVSLLPAGGAGQVAVSAPEGCRWSAVSDSEWLHVTGSPSGTGDGRVAYAADATAAVMPRGGALTIGSARVSFGQQGAEPSDCTYGITPAEKVVAVAGGSFEVRVLAPAGCRWQFGGTVPWLHVVADPFGDPNGNGNGTVVAVIDPNPSATARTGTATIAGETLTVSQDGANAAACSYDLASAFPPPGAGGPGTAEFDAAGGSGQARLTTAPACGWHVTASDPTGTMLAIEGAGEGTGNALIEYRVARNASLAPRQGRLGIIGTSGLGSGEFVVAQRAATCLYDVSPSARSFGAGGGAGTVNVTATPASCSWRATASDGWIAVSGGTGTGAGSFDYIVAAHAGTSSRRGFIVVAGLTGVNPSASHQVDQAGP